MRVHCNRLLWVRKSDVIATEWLYSFSPAAVTRELLHQALLNLGNSRQGKAYIDCGLEQA
jgi:hypothetical protein